MERQLRAARAPRRAGKVILFRVHTPLHKSGQIDRGEYDRANYGAVCGCAQLDLLSASGMDCSICCNSFFI